MNNFRYIKYSAFLVPALAMGISAASAGDDKNKDPCDQERTTASASATAEQDRDQRSFATSEQDRDERSSATAEQDRGRMVAGDPPASSNRDDVVFKSDTSERTHTSNKNDTSATAHTGMHDGNYLATVPANNFFSDNLIGQDVTNKRNGEVIGSIEEILIDGDGQVAAVILSSGGLMGIGEKDIAIAWDQIERTKVTGDDDDEYELSVDFTEDSLADAPAFERKSDK